MIMYENKMGENVIEEVTMELYKLAFHWLKPVMM